MNILLLSPLLLLLALAPPAAATEVWKCRIAGELRYADRPCPTGTQQAETRLLRPNELAVPRLPVPAVETAVPAAPAQAQADPGPANSCPSDAELRDLETSASSTTLGMAEKAFLLDEHRRALQCRKGQGRYSAQDWAISREARADQNSRSKAADARRRAEAMHSAADPLEGERIARQRLTAERRGHRPRLLPADPPAPAQR